MQSWLTLDTLELHPVTPNMALWMLPNRVLLRNACRSGKPGLIATWHRELCWSLPVRIWAKESECVSESPNEELVLEMLVSQKEAGYTFQPFPHFSFWCLNGKQFSNLQHKNEGWFTCQASFMIVAFDFFLHAGIRKEFLGSLLARYWPDRDLLSVSMVTASDHHPLGLNNIRRWGAGYRLARVPFLADG